MTPSRLFAVGRADAHVIECAEFDSPFQRYITDVAHDSSVTHDTRYAAWEFGGRSWCQGAVQEIVLLPKTEVGAKAKLRRRERPSTGQSEEALWFRCRFRRQFQPSAMKVPFSEAGLRGSDFRFPASTVPFSEAARHETQDWRSKAAQGFGWGFRDTYITFTRTSAAERRPILAGYEFKRAGRLHTMA